MLGTPNLEPRVTPRVSQPAENPRRCPADLPQSPGSRVPLLAARRLAVAALLLYRVLLAYFFPAPESWLGYPLWIKGEALRQVLVNRYYGNVRPAGRRESLTSFGNGPLSAGGASKAGAGGRTRVCLSVRAAPRCPARPSLVPSDFSLAGLFLWNSKQTNLSQQQRRNHPRRSGKNS